MKSLSIIVLCSLGLAVLARDQGGVFDSNRKTTLIPSLRPPLPGRPFCAETTAQNEAVGARGQLMCGNQPLANAEVKLWELDTWPDPDDLLATVNTDSQGRFQIQGTENELTTISPVVKFYHRCNNKGLFNLPALCKRKVTYAIPSTYITNGRTTNRYYDFGTLNMEAKQKNEDTECIGK